MYIADHSNSVLVELVGMAGVGKSTIARELAPILKCRNTHVVLTNQMATPITAAIAPRDVVITTKVVRAIGTSTDKLGRRQSIGLFKDLVKGRYWRRVGGILLCDQGMVHRISTLHKYSDRVWCSEWVNMIRNHPAMPDLTVLITASKEQVEVRKLKRDGVAHHSAFYAESSQRLERLLADLNSYRIRNQGTHYMVVVNEQPGDLGRCVSTIEQRINDILSQMTFNGTGPSRCR